MKTNFSRFGRSAVSVVLSAVMLLSTFLVSAETVNVDSVSEAVSSDSAAVDNSSDKASDNAVSSNAKSDKAKVPNSSGSSVSTVYFYNSNNWSTVYAYIYSGSGDSATKYNGDWPGNVVTTAENGLYKVENIDTSAETIIFNNASAQTVNISLSDADSTNNIYVLDGGSDGEEKLTGSWKNSSNYNAKDYVYFRKNDLTNWSKVYAYFFSTSNASAQNAEWPGLEMEQDSSDPTVYRLEVNSSYSNYDRVIFNDGGDNQTGRGRGHFTYSDHVNKKIMTPTNGVYNDPEDNYAARMNSDWQDYNNNPVPEGSVAVYAKNGTIRDGFRKYSELATTTIKYTDGDTLSTESQYKGQVKYAVAERNKELTITTTLNDVYYLGGSSKSKIKNIYYVKAFCINGYSYNIISEAEAETKNGTYTCTYTVKDTDPDVIEITPIYFYFTNGSDDYITFYAEDFSTNPEHSGVKDQWGDTVSAYVWYSNDQAHDEYDPNADKKPALGGYPGQPMVYDGGSYYMQVPKKLNGTNAEVMGVTLNNYYWDTVHREHGDIGNSQYNCQTYDYDDFVALMHYDKTKDIIANFKYGKYNQSNGGNVPATYTDLSEDNKKAGVTSVGINNLDLNQFFDKNQKSGNTANGWKVLVDYYDYPIDLFGNRLKHADGSYYTEDEILAEALKNNVKVNVVSDGYATDEHGYIGYYATRWYVYENNGSGTGTFKGALPPSAFINATNDSGTAFSKDNFLSYSDDAAAYKDKTNNSGTNQTYAELASSLFTSYKNQPVVITFESEIYDDGYNTPADDLGYRSEVRWYFSRENSTIKADVKIQVVDSDGKIVQIDGSDFDSFNSGSHTGSTTGVNAYFTNLTFNEATSSGDVAENDDDSFKFKADSISAKHNDDKGDYVYVFRGWYLNTGSASYNPINPGDLYSVTGSRAMNSNATFVARYEKVYVNDSLVISHELYTNADTTDHSNAPEKQNGTGTPHISVRILKEDGSALVTYPDTTGTITVDPTVLVNNDAKKIEVILSTVTDDDDTKWYDIYRDNTNSYIISSLQEANNSNEDLKNEKNAGDNNQVIYDSTNNVYGVSGKLDDKKVVYTYDISSFLNNGGSELARHEIKYYSDHYTDKQISAKVVVKYSEDGTNYTVDDFEDANDTSSTTTECLKVNAYFTNTNTDFTNKTATGDIKANANDNFNFTVDNSGYVTAANGKLYKFEGWYLQTGEGENADDSTVLSTTSTGKKAMTESATFVAKYVLVGGESDEKLDISHVLLSSLQSDTNAPKAHNGTGTPTVTVQLVKKDDNGKVTDAIKLYDNVSTYDEEGNVTPVTVYKTILDEFKSKGYELQVKVITTSDEDSNVVGVYRYGKEDSSARTDNYYKSDSKKIEETDDNVIELNLEDENVKADKLDSGKSFSTWTSDDGITNGRGSELTYTYDIASLYGTGDDKDTLKITVLKYATDLATSKINITFKYYDREVADTTQPTDINTIPSETTLAKYIGDSSKNVDKIGYAITGSVEVLSTLVNNVIDGYDFWSTQADAVGGIKGETNMRDDNKTTYCAIAGADFEHHADRYSRLKNQDGYKIEDGDTSDGEQWVTYYADEDGNEEIEVKNGDISNSDLYRVKKVVVWGFNYPKTYYVDYYTDISGSTADSNGIIIAGGTATRLEGYYYNQRVGEKDNNTVIDKETNHLGAYSINGVQGTKVEAPNKDGYDFDGWYENVNGKYVKVSSDQSYGNRVTKTTNLYAGYREKNTIEKKGITLTQNDVEHYVDEDGTPRVRYVTVLNSYGFDDSDDNFKRVALVYVKFADNSINSSVTIDTILTDGLKNEIISKLNSDTTGASALTVEISNVTTDATTKEISYTYNIVPTYTDKNNGSVNKGDVRFTNKNRAQFVLDLSEDTVSGDNATSPNLLVFAAVKYQSNEADSNFSKTFTGGDTTNGYKYIASDNYVVYQKGEAK